MEEKNSGKIELMSYIRALRSKATHCAAIVVVGTVIAVIYNLTAAPTFLSQSIIIPTSSEDGSSTKLMSGLLQGLTLGGSSGKNNTVLLLLKSKRLRTKVINALKLDEVFLPDKKNLSQNLREHLLDNSLNGIVKVESDKIFTEKITILVETGNAELSAKVAKQYLVELQNLIHENAFIKAKRYRLFLEDQVSRNKEELLEMGKEISSFYRKNPISEQGRLNVPIGLISETGNAEGFKNYQEFKAYLDVAQNSNAHKEQLKIVKDVPLQIYLNYVITQQKILEEKNALLVQSYQMALLDEAKQEPTFQILEEPVVAPFKFKPQRKLIMLGGFGLSVLAAILYALFTYKEPHKKQS